MSNEQGKVDLTVMDVTELMRHGGPDLVAEELERRVQSGADPLHVVLGADALGKLVERAKKLREECAPQSIVLMFEAMAEDTMDDIPPFLRKAPTAEPPKKAETHEKAVGAQHPTYLKDASVGELLHALKAKGGTFAAVADAQLLVLKKSNDYNRSELDVADQHSARDVYFPFGHASYAQMLHVKSQRINSLVDAELKGRPTNFEGLRDTALDLINYASFLAERLGRDAPF